MGTCFGSTALQPLPPGLGGAVTWIHVGDLHMTTAGQQNDIDLGRIVDTVNSMYSAGEVSFVYLPGDIADNGTSTSYNVVRSQLDRLALPWCGIVGDHDVQAGTFTNFRNAICTELTGSFVVGRYRFLRLNTFAEPRPDAFLVDDDQLAWVEAELRACEQEAQRAVLLMHCYPSDLKQGGKELANLIKRYPVLLVDMGHTHYNELSNDGRAIYSATRSTGQIEEGAAGFSVMTLDGDRVSWNFVEPDAPGLVQITAPVDRRLLTEFLSAEVEGTEIEVRAKIWSRHVLQTVTATLSEQTVPMHHDGGVSWSCRITRSFASTGSVPFHVNAVTEAGAMIESAVEVVFGSLPAVERYAVDQQNSIGAWEERGILGTQLGPNKNGRQW